MSVLATLTDEKRTQVLQACAGAQCHLLLGAGASQDSVGADGKHLPGANSLARQIEEHFGLRKSDRDLREVASRLLRREKGEGLYVYLHQRFSGCVAAPWYRNLTAVAWKRIWTLNVDDVVEVAYRNRAWTHAQQTTSYSWEDAFQEDDRLLQVVHLHGDVHGPTPRKLMFGLIEYVEAVSSGKTWHSVFGDLWMQNPFIVVGAGLRDEIDLARFLENRSRLSSQLALYVVDELDPDWREDLELWGLTVVEATAADFFKELAEEVAPLQKKRMALRSENRRAAPSLVHFGQHFTAIGDLTEGRKHPRHDLISGDYPTFQDIHDDVDVQFDFSSRLERSALDRVRAMNAGMLMVLGPPFSGKSVGIMRAAVNLERSGTAVFWFSGEKRPNPRMIVEAITQIGSPIVLVVDDIAPWASSLAEIVRLAEASGETVIVIGSSRAKRLPYLVSSIPMAVWDTEDIFHSSPMTRSDAELVDALLDRSGRLNHLQRMPRGQRIRMFIDDGVFSGLYRAQGGSSFQQRVAVLYEKTLSTDETRLAYIAAILAELNLPVTTPVVRGLLGDVRRLEDEQAGMTDVFEIGTDAIRLRHRAIGLDYLQSKLSDRDARETIWQVLNSLRNSVNEVTIRSGSPSSEIVKGLLRARFLHDLIGPDEASAMMSDLEGTFGWDGGYWEQRALDARFRREWHDAVGFAAKAADMLDDSHRNTTLGTILFARAAFDGDLASEDVFSSVLRGHGAFEHAAALGSTNPVPILHFLGGLDEVVRRRGRDLRTSEIVRIQGWWSTWFSRGRSLKAFAIGELDEELEREQLSWQTTVSGLA